MVKILSISWRTIWRNRRRTLINMSAVGFGLALLLFAFSMIESYMDEAQNDLGNTGMGHIEIYAQDYRVKKNATKFIAEPDAVLTQIATHAPEGTRMGWRVVVMGLASTAWGSRGVRLLGVEPGTEARLSKFFTDVPKGAVLEAGDDRGVLVGEGLAKKLKLKVKSKLRVMAQRADGEIGAELFRVRGIFHSISPATSKSQAFVTASAARRLLGVENVAHQIVVQLPRASQADPLAEQLRAELDGGLELLSFGELMPALKMFQGYIDKMFVFITLGIYLLVGLGVLNTMLMSVMERTREFGVMMAVGTRARRLVALVLGESFWVATLAVIAGALIGVAVTWVVAEFGLLDWREIVGEGLDFGGSTISMLIRPKLSWGRVAQVSAVVWVLTVLIGLYPAWRVSRFQPADALRAN